MKKNRRLSFITLTTGHSQETPRKEVTGQAFRYSQQLLTEGLENDSVKVFQDPEDSLLLEVQADGPALWARIMSGSDAKRFPLITMGVLAQGPDETRLWRGLHEAEGALPVVTDPSLPPRAPWLGVRLELDAVLRLSELPILPDLERCLAWAWLDMAEQPKTANPA